MCVVVSVTKTPVSSKVLAVPHSIRLELFHCGHSAICFPEAFDSTICRSHVQLRIVDPAGGATTTLWSTGVERLWRMATVIQVWIAIKLMRLEVQWEPGGGGSSQWHAPVRVPHSSAFSSGRISFAQHVRRLWRWHHFYIISPRAILFLASIQSAARALLSGKDLVQMSTAELPRGLDGTVILFRGRVPQACCPVLFHPSIKRLLLLGPVLWGTGVSLAEEQ
jgi:hypothetical protein